MAYSRVIYNLRNCFSRIKKKLYCVNVDQSDDSKIYGEDNGIRWIPKSSNKKANKITTRRNIWEGKDKHIQEKETRRWMEKVSSLDCFFQH